MANPQLEDGHTKIANEFVDKFATIDLSPYEWRVLWAILRKTYGWNKKSDYISLTQFSKITNIPPQHVARTLSRLIERKLIYKKNGNLIMEYGLQKDYTKWLSDNKTVPMQVLPTQVLPTEVLPTEVLPAQDRGTTSAGTPPMPIGTTSAGTNKSNIKDNIQKTIDDVKTSPPIKDITYEKIDGNDNTIIENKIKKPKDNKQYGDQVKSIFAFLDKQRGYRPPKRNAEAASIIRMLKHSYTVDQITNTW
jgi:phage replication O-like protein O